MTFAAVLLAGGESRRMGRDKATLKIGGEALWQRQLNLLRSLGPERVFVSARTAPDWLPADVELLLDDSPSRGPLSGLTKAFSAMQTTHLVALAVDMPFMTADELGRLLAEVTEGHGVVPVIGQIAEPLAAVYPAEAAADFQTALAGPDFSLQSLARSLNATGRVKLRQVPTERAPLYRSANLPSDVSEFGA